MSSKSNDFGFEDTKSTILDYFLMFRDVKWAVVSTLGVSVVVFLLILGLFNILVETRGTIQEKQLYLTIVVLTIILTLAFWLPLVNGRLIIKIIGKGRKLQRELIEIQNNLTRRSYMMNFELVEPEIIIKDGSPQLEKIMNHLSYVFPEVDRVNKKRIKKKNSVEKYAKKFKRKLHFLRNYDLVIKTSLGWFVIQFYEKLTFPDVEKIVKKFSIEKTIGTEIQRVVIVCKEFDSMFEKDELVKQMDSLKRKIRVDLISENEYGYSTIWID